MRNSEIFHVDALKEIFPEATNTINDYDPNKNRKEYSIEYLKNLSKTLEDLVIKIMRVKRIVDNEKYIKMMGWEDHYE